MTGALVLLGLRIVTNGVQLDLDALAFIAIAGLM